VLPTTFSEQPFAITHLVPTDLLPWKANAKKIISRYNALIDIIKFGLQNKADRHYTLSPCNFVFLY
jgi:hypothetical protein